MFKVIILAARVEIELCPSKGLDAIDFRRRYGLPDEPSDRQVVPAYEFVDEAFVRENKELANEYADITPASVSSKSYYIVSQELRAWDFHRRWPKDDIKVQPTVLKAYLDNQCEETARNLYRSLWTAERRSKARVVAKECDLSTEVGQALALRLYGGDTEELAFAIALADADQDGRCI